MRFIYGTNIENFEGEKVAELEQVVVDPRTNQVTHLVAKKGFLLSDDKVIPISLVMDSNQDHIRLYDFEGSFDDLDDFTEYHYVKTNQPQETAKGKKEDNIIPLLAYPPSGALGLGFAPAIRNYPEVEKQRVQNIPADSVQISRGDKVLGLNGEHVGDVEEVVVSSQSDQITHFIVSKGIVFNEEKLIPANWVQGYDDDQVRLVVDSKIIQSLPELER